MKENSAIIDVSNDGRRDGTMDEGMDEGMERWDGAL